MRRLRKKGACLGRKRELDTEKVEVEMQRKGRETEDVSGRERKAER